MFRLMLVIGVVVFVLAIGGLIMGFVSSNPILPAVSILCAVPIAMFALGYALSDFVARWDVVPKAARASKSVNRVS